MTIVSCPPLVGQYGVNLPPVDIPLLLLSPFPFFPPFVLLEGKQMMTRKIVKNADKHSQLHYMLSIHKFWDVPYKVVNYKSEEKRREQMVIRNVQMCWNNSKCSNLTLRLSTTIGYYFLLAVFLLSNLSLLIPLCN